MGWETANIHLGSPKAIPAVRTRPGRAERPVAAQSGKTMLKVTLDDWKVWRRKSGFSAQGQVERPHSCS